MMKAIYEVAGGIPGGKKLKAVVPGGSSCPLLKADECDIPMDYDTLAKVGSMLGSGGMVVLDETTDMVKFALRIMRFYAHESCGWCIPCREGTTWLQKILQRFDDGGGRQGRHRAAGRAVEEHAGPDVLRAGRCGGDADHLHRREVRGGFRKATGGVQAEPTGDGLNEHGGNGKAHNQRTSHRGRKRARC